MRAHDCDRCAQFSDPGPRAPPRGIRWARCPGIPWPATVIAVAVGAPETEPARPKNPVTAGSTLSETPWPTAETVAVAVAAEPAALVAGAKLDGRASVAKRRFWPSLKLCHSGAAASASALAAAARRVRASARRCIRATGSSAAGGSPPRYSRSFANSR